MPKHFEKPGFFSGLHADIYAKQHVPTSFRPTGFFLCKDFATVLDVQPGRDASSSHRFSGVKAYDIQTAGEAGEALGKLSGYKEVPRSQAQKTASRGLVWKSDGQWIYVDIPGCTVFQVCFGYAML